MINPIFPIFVGCGRSGTTLLRNVFDAHPELAVTHEAHFMAPMAMKRDRYERQSGFEIDVFLADLEADPNYRRQGIDADELRAALESARPDSFADAVRMVFKTYATSRGKGLYGDKTPGSVNHIPLLAALFPEARFVQIIRDGRAVALSYLDRPEWGPTTVGAAAHHWRGRVTKGRQGGAALGDQRYHEVRYEELVTDAERVVARVCEFLELRYHSEMLDFHRRGDEFIAATKDPDAFRNLAMPVTRGIRDWRTEMGPRDVSLFEAIAGDLLVELGYEVTTSTGFGTRIRAASAAAAWQGRRVMSRVSRVVGSMPRPSGETRS